MKNINSLTIDVSGSNFKLQNLTIGGKIPKKSKCSILLVKAKWCGYCTQYLPIFEELSSRYNNVNFIVLEQTVNRTILDQWSNLLRPAFEIEGFPTVVLYDTKGYPLKIIDRANLEKEIAKFI